MPEPLSAAVAASGRRAVDVRSAHARDAAAWWRLQRGIYDEGSWFVGDGPPSEGALSARIRTLDTTRAAVLLALVDEEIAGWCEATRLAAMRLEHVAVLTVAVAAHLRRRGCGEALLDEAEVWACGLGVRKLSLSVRGANAAAQALYRRCGFEVEGIEREQVRDVGGFEDNLIMAKFLADRA
ncbi:MAG: GNAT family N-acetyltransferase [Trueperaceae bacterium]|nr:GNAT family N-acetyltransferase [Trueperaceae bacterium]